MKVAGSLMTLLLTGVAWTMDEYPPLSPGKLEIGLGYAPVFLVGYYDKAGRKHPVRGNPLIHLSEAQIKIGIFGGLGLEAQWILRTDNHAMSVIRGQHVDDKTDIGLLQPDVGLKYALGNTGASLFGNVTFPFVTGSFVTSPSTAYWGLEPGFVYNREFGYFQAVMKASYIFALQNEELYEEGNTLQIYLKPGVRLSGSFAVHVGAEFVQHFSSMFRDHPMGDAGQVFTLAPGLRYSPASWAAFEASVLYAHDGENVFKVIAPAAHLYVTLF